MPINQISTANTFGQLITAVAAMIAVSNNLTDGPQVTSNSAWTFTNPGVGVNVSGGLIATRATIDTLNTSHANVTNETVVRSNVSTANITTANIVGATITNINSTGHATANVNVSVLLQVSGRANIFSANIESANVGTLIITSLSAASLTVPVLNASFANVTTLSVTGTSQHTALVAVLTTTDNANVKILNTSSANISNLTAATLNASFANITTMTVGTLNSTSANLSQITVPILNASFANITSSNIISMNVSTANISNLTVTTLNVSFANLTTGTMASNPTTNLGISTKNYADTGAGGNVVWKNTFSAKGDLPVGSGVNTFSIISSSGSNGQVLLVDTQTASGLRYSNRASQTFRGLVIGTSVKDKVANGTQLTVTALDEVVMDDGEVVGGWTVPATIDISSSGNAALLDTGAAIANTWYEVYAIRKRSDGTKNFILHRALDRLANQNTFTTSYPLQTFLAAGLAANNTSNLYIRLAQSFTPNIAGPLTSIEIRAFRTSTPTGNMWLTLEANTAGAPSGTTLATSRRMDVARLPLTNPANLRFVFDSTANVELSTSYFWIFNSDYAGSGTAFVNVAFSLANTNIGANGVNRGLPYGNTGSTWDQLTSVGTFIYKTYVEANSTPLTLPAGFDQRCLISYAATDVNTRLKEYHQKDRTITAYPTAQWAVHTLQIANPEVIDLGVFATIPPVPCVVSFFATGTSLNTYGIGRLHALDLPSAASTSDIPGGAVIGQISFGTTASASAPVLVAAQAVLVKSALANFKLFPVSITF